MFPIRGITVSVGQHYADLLKITLPQNVRHLAECLVVTAPGDPAVEVARGVPGVRVLETDAFTRHGAMFNKSLGMEEGFSELGRDGWILIWDADVILPPALPLHRCRPELLHGIRRRVLEDAGQYRPDLEWRLCPVANDAGPIGFFQLFHASAVGHVRPWYDVSFAHAGGGDAAFMTHWPRDRWSILPGEVLHLGRVDQNWFGTTDAARDVMGAFVIRNGWTRAAARVDPAVNDRVGPIVERVVVPGYAPSDFELPFVRRARQHRDARPHG